ncbi:MAG: efflux RND transporter periplasmic adaptor subunit [Acidobacteriota bacterium]|nr:efflux RND transporter periplasmic adaptor subunit [Acidobacteriota bacterium]
MRKFLVIAIVVAVGLGAAAYFGVFSSEDTAAAGPGGGQQAGGAAAPGGQRPQQQGGGAGGFGGFGMPGGGGGPRMPLTVEMASVKRGDLAAHLTVVGNLIGLQTVEVAPKTGGRLMSVSVQLGDRVRRGQVMAKIEDREIREQVNQQEASLEVSKATIRQREADLKVAELNFERSKNLFQRQLLAKQSLDDAESRYMAAEAQIDLSKAQLNQTDARLQELRINLQNTTVTSPVDGFVGKRYVDPGAMVSQSQPVASVVEISRLKLIVNVVEKDLRLVDTGDTGDVEVDAYPGETFRGRIARVAPVLDPATRTASMEIEIQNSDNRLKPGMYARVSLVVEERKATLVAPKSAVIDFESKRGVWMPNDEKRARFVPVELGIEDAERVEIKSGLKEGDRIVTTGATAVRNNDVLLIAGEAAPASGFGGAGGAAGAGRGGRGGATDGARKFQGGQRPPGAEGQRPPGGQRPPQ